MDYTPDRTPADTAPVVADGWRIDDLAQRSGVSVDTIRFWQRHRLLPPPRRIGRIAFYGVPHLERLGQIRELQERRLSLAAIKHFLDASREALASTLFSGSGAHSAEDLAHRSGLDVAMVRTLEANGLLQDPATLGRDSYDDGDVRVAQAVKQLLDAGLPDTFVMQLCAIYAEGFSLMRHAVLEILEEPSDFIPVEEHAEIVEEMGGHLGRALGPAIAILEYRHQRTVQLMTRGTRRRDALGVVSPED